MGNQLTICSLSREDNQKAEIKKIEIKNYKIVNRLTISLPKCTSLEIWSNAPIKVVCGLYGDIFISDVEDIEALLRNDKKFISLPVCSEITIIGNASVELRISNFV